ncbi:VOC family protein [Paenibacillus chibensis]|uniref:VOC family protein n=1 Tax=Paenibacillus chibensis TaxID=59846 RepID=A0ABU6Q093_9BACL|nr:VOC family protein [Paenibacillus chibensis]MEC0369720.1 VOC family protein [Paenibacillus chibensis]MED5020548.1 VOC family protein [Paenibacillus chibensis]
MFKKLECVCIHTKDIDKSLSFYTSMGLKENWRIERVLDSGFVWTLVGLIFPELNSSELVLSNHPQNQSTEIEILVDDVQEAYNELSKHEEIEWIGLPFETESGHVAIMEAPDGNVFVLVGK